MRKFYTDYPILELGDIYGQIAPIREIKLLNYDWRMYVDIEVCGVKDSIKRGYIYKKPIRSNEAKSHDIPSHGWLKRRFNNPNFSGEVENG